MDYEVFTLKINEKEYPIKVTKIDGVLYFVAEDIATALGYESPAGAIIANCNPSKIASQSFVSPFNKKEAIKIFLLPEEELYNLVKDSETTSYIQKWIEDEIKPEIKEASNQELDTKRENTVTISKLDKELKDIMRRYPNKR